MTVTWKGKFPETVTALLEDEQKVTVMMMVTWKVKGKAKVHEMMVTWKVKSPAPESTLLEDKAKT